MDILFNSPPPPPLFVIFDYLARKYCLTSLENWRDWCFQLLLKRLCRMWRGEMSRKPVRDRQRHVYLGLKLERTPYPWHEKNIFVTYWKKAEGMNVEHAIIRELEFKVFQGHRLWENRKDVWVRCVLSLLWRIFREHVLITGNFGCQENRPTSACTLR